MREIKFRGRRPLKIKGFLLSFGLYTAAFWYARIDTPVWLVVLLAIVTGCLMVGVARAIDAKDAVTQGEQYK